MLLAGDIGGTKTLLTFGERGGTGLDEGATEVFASREAASLEALIERFLAGRPGVRVEAACFGVAGAVLDGRVTTTNLPWPELDERSLSRVLGGAPVKLLNDLEATALGMLELPAAERVALNPAADAGRPGNVAVIAAGTGLGEAYLVWDGQRHHSVASEGGHTGFSPRDQQEIELLRFLHSEHGRVSWERVLSGPGIRDLYRFTRSTSGEPEPGWLTGELAQQDPARVVTDVGLEKRDPVCERTLAFFASLFGSRAGDLALETLAVGGVFVGGGIAPRMLPVLQAGGFMAAFTDKGRFAELLRGLPVQVATNPRTPLLGAVRRAAELL